MVLRQMFPQSLQTHICKHIEASIAKRGKVLNAQDFFNNEVPRNPAGGRYMIVDKVEDASCVPGGGSVLYHFLFEDIRMDKFFFQMTPAVVGRVGVLEVTKEGEMIILDENYNSMNVNSNFNFDGCSLKLVLNEDLMYQRSSSCSML